ncbi:hypothetical protein PMI08_03155 [Brevibacillus sp. CF112]|uniref:hypothetical protein n=1 Tax=Brevibacillus sp. CF112 TaxID=1144311 RepID=UPI0002718813|nr:hypothetical protein [Brevibacillus sp. CF112]EJL42504.1 hypothetical protein PMI08_03155 [Brevibacillus sp. CF112]
MAALDARPYTNGLFAKRDLYPGEVGWSTHELSIPESLEQYLFEQPGEESKAEAQAVQAEKASGNAGGTLASDNWKNIMIWVGVILALVILFGL